MVFCVLYIWVFNQNDHWHVSESTNKIHTDTQPIKTGCRTETLNLPVLFLGLVSVLVIDSTYLYSAYVFFVVYKQIFICILVLIKL